MISRDALVAAFAEEGTSLRRAVEADVDGIVSHEITRDLLVDIGIPEQLAEQFFSSRNFQTCGSHLIIGSDANVGLILVDGRTGEVFSRKDGGMRRINLSLEQFVEFLYQIQMAVNRFEEDEWPEGEHLGNFMQEFVELMKDVDSVAMDEAADYWDGILRAIF